MYLNLIDITFFFSFLSFYEKKRDSIQSTHQKSMFCHAVTVDRKVIYLLITSGIFPYFASGIILCTGPGLLTLTEQIRWFGVDTFPGDDFCANPIVINRWICRYSTLFCPSPRAGWVARTLSPLWSEEWRWHMEWKVGRCNVIRVKDVCSMLGIIINLPHTVGRKVEVIGTSSNPRLLWHEPRICGSVCRWWCTLNKSTQKNSTVEGDRTELDWGKVWGREKLSICGGGKW